MSEYAKGDRVLLEAWADAMGTYECPADGEVHAHPGVPVADLVEELEKRDWCGRIEHHYKHEWQEKQRRWHELRAAREAANKPKLKEGQKVWLPGKVEKHDGFVIVVPVNVQAVPGGSGEIRADYPPRLCFHLDDIKTEEP